MLTLALLSCVLRFFGGVNGADCGETLYNGIVLPSPWPPRNSDFPVSVEKDPVIPPYLLAPPAVIPIDVGRQLFVDDFLIGETTIERTWHLARYHAESPVLKPDKPWENPDHAAAMVFSDGVKNGKRYAFWVSPDSAGASYGYVAAGGPGFFSNRDPGSSPSGRGR